MSGRAAKLLRKISKLRGDNQMQYRIRKRNWGSTSSQERGKFRRVIERALEDMKKKIR
jgi:hypothetical protein